MKNIFLLPTNKPSWLSSSIKGLFLQNTCYTSKVSKSFGLTNKHLYIVSDNEKIVKGDWVLHLTTKNISKVSEDGSYYGEWKKIILSTDLDAIEDGVHEIPKSFIATYVLLQNDYIGEVINRVEITKDVLYDNGTDDTFNVKVKIQYIISIPSDESKKIITYTEDEVWSLVNKLNNTLNIGSDLSIEEWFKRNKK